MLENTSNFQAKTEMAKMIVNGFLAVMYTQGMLDDETYQRLKGDGMKRFMQFAQDARDQKINLD